MNKKRVVAALFVLILFIAAAFILISTKSLSYFTDRGDTSINGTVAVVDVNSFLNIEKESVEFSDEIVSGYFATANNGTIQIEGDTTMSLQWKDEFQDINKVYLYPANMSNTSIKEDIAGGGGKQFNFTIDGNIKVVSVYQEVMPGHAIPTDFKLIVSGVEGYTGRLNISVNSSFNQEGGGGFSASSGISREINIDIPEPIEDIDARPQGDGSAYSPPKTTESTSLQPADSGVYVPPAKELYLEVPDNWDAFINDTNMEE